MPDFIYSVIIPHKNLPNLLIRCLRSIPEREDVQVIVVDDCSDDADSYLKKYPELRRPYLEFYATKEGRGAGYARNVGLKHARGRWVTFFDCDDIVFLENFNNVLDKAVNCPYKLIVWGFIRKNADETEYYNRCKNSYDIRPLEKFDKLREGTVAPWSMMVRTDFIRQKGFLFDEIPIGNDQMFSVRVLAHLAPENVGEYASPVYNYIIRPGSITQQNSSEELDSLRIETSISCTEYAKKNGYDFLSQRVNDLYRVKKRSLKLFLFYSIEILRRCGSRIFFHDMVHMLNRDYNSNPIVKRIFCHYMNFYNRTKKVYKGLSL